MVKPFARSSGMDILKYSRLPRATPSRWARRIPIRRILFNYLNRLRKKLISALIYFISFFSLLPTRSPRNQASAAAPPPSCRQRRAVTLPPPLQHSRCCNRATTVTLFTAATLRAAATAADAAAAAVPPPSFRRRRAVGLPPPPTSRCRQRRSLRQDLLILIDFFLSLRLFRCLLSSLSTATRLVPFFRFFSTCVFLG